ncbi:MAG: hypothetical protein HOM07_17495, partial [Rhodospirillaceae bacterium]|nr:hypothetical protein [Rhodospirillaceae bacterium]
MVRRDLTSDERLYRNLVKFNTAVIIIGFIGLISAAVWYKNFVITKVSNLLEREIVSSESLASLAELTKGSENADPTLSSPVRKFGLKIAEKHLRRIDILSKRLVRQHGLTSADRMWVPAIFIAGEKAWDVKVRLRGDGTAHWATAKKSWRIKFKKNQLYDGYREINLVLARERHFETEILAYDLARNQGLFVRDGGAATLKINRVDMGDYVWFEQITGESLERNRRTGGNVVTPDNSWIDYGILSTFTNDYYHFLSGYRTVIKNDPNRGIMLDRWKSVLDLVKNGTGLEISRRIPLLVDMDKFAAWSATILLFGNKHGLAEINLSWYYNGATGLFEPIMYDVNIGTYSRDVGGLSMLNNTRSFDFGNNFVASRLLQQADIRRRRDKVLHDLLANQFDEISARQSAVFARLQPYMIRGISAQPPDSVRREFKDRQAMLGTNRRVLLYLLRRARLFAETAMSIGDGQLIWDMDIRPDALADIKINQITVNISAPVRIDSGKVTAFLSGDGAGKSLAVETTQDGNMLSLKFKELRIWQKRAANLEPEVTTWRLRMTLPTQTSLDKTRALPVDFVIDAENALTGQPVHPRRSRATPGLQKIAPDLAEDALRSPSLVIERSGLPFRAEGKNLVLGPGEYQLANSLILSSGFGLVLQAGVHLKLGPGVSIVSRKPIQIIGTAAAPVAITALDKDAPWGVLGVIAPGGKSVIRHARISGGSEAWVNGVFLSGQVAVHYGDLDMTNSIISGARADDGLNVKYGRVDFKNNHFVNNSSDGFDGDWVTGKIDRSLVAGNGGDGLDFSGSKVVVSNSRLERMGD